MKKLKRIKDKYTGAPVFRDEETGTVYGRVIGGLCFSSVDSYSPAHSLCALGEEREKDFPSGVHVVRVLAEEQEIGVEELLERAVMVQDALHCAAWMFPSHEPEQVRIVKWTRNRAMLRLPRLSIVPPPTRDFLVMHGLAQARTVTSKTMFFGPGSTAAAQYVSVRGADFSSEARRYPAVAAYLYALAGIDMRPAGSAATRETPAPAQGGY